MTRCNMIEQLQQTCNDIQALIQKNQKELKGLRRNRRFEMLKRIAQLEEMYEDQTYAIYLLSKGANKKF